MTKDIPITEARYELTSLPKYFVKEPGAISVTRRGRPVLAILPWDLYESIIETLEIMGDKELMAALSKGLQNVKEGKVISWEKAKTKLGL